MYSNGCCSIHETPGMSQVHAAHSKGFCFYHDDIKTLGKNYLQAGHCHNRGAPWGRLHMQ